MRTALFSLAGVALMLCAFGISYLRDGWNASAHYMAGGALYSAQNTPTAPNGAAYPATDAPAELLLPVENMLQNPELPNGCEATSLAIVLRYRGYYTDNVEIAYHYLPREELTATPEGMLGPDPATAYAGDPASATGGYYCLAPAVKSGAQSYLDSAFDPARPQDVSGISIDGLQGLLQGGTPVIVWTTMDYGPARTCDFSWRLPDGGRYTPYANLHCLVLVGYTESEMLLCDPLKEGIQAVDTATFEAGFEALGRQAVVIEG